MVTTTLTEERLVRILNSLIIKKHRNFTVVFTHDCPSRSVATYLRSERLITIHAGHFDNPLDMLGAGIHEVVHHVNWNLRAPGLRDRTVKRHGKEFRRLMGAMIGVFNFRYRELFGGRFVWSRRKPTRSPRFVEFTVSKAQRRRSIASSAVQSRHQKSRNRTPKFHLLPLGCILSCHSVSLCQSIDSPGVNSHPSS